jgi:lysophospholipase L1-like esterase
MDDRSFVTIRVSRRGLLLGLVALSLSIALVAQGGGLWAQKTQENFKDKFNISQDTGGVSVTTSADGRYVYVAGPEGVIVSDNFGKTGTWVQTVRLK